MLSYFPRIEKKKSTRSKDLSSRILVVIYKKDEWSPIRVDEAGKKQKKLTDNVSHLSALSVDIFHKGGRLLIFFL